MQNFKQVETKSSTTTDTTSRSLQFTAGGEKQADCCCSNFTDQPIYVKFGTGSAPTAVAGEGMPIASGAQIVLRKDAAEFVSYVAEATATGRVNFTAGTGS